MKKILLTFLFPFFVINYFAQERSGQWSIYVNGINVEESKSFKRVRFDSYKRQLNEIRLEHISEGFLTANIDSIKQVDSLKKVFINYYKGEQYNWAKLKFLAKDASIISAVGFGEDMFINKPFSSVKISRLMEQTIRYLEQNGYPFARIKLDSVQFLEKAISAKVNLEKGPEITIDSIYVKSNERISIPTVYNYIKVKPGDIYNEQLLSEIKTRIKEIPYLEEVKPLELEFTNNKCAVYIYLKSIKSSNFNGVLGVQPDQNGRIGITGDLKVKLLNSFYRGETIDFNWRQTQQLTQDLDIKFNYPFLFNTPFGIDTHMKIYKRDTSYVDANFNVGVDYVLSGLNKLTVFFENQNSSLLSTKKYEGITTLPEFADIRKNNYGLKLEAEKLDYRFNPRKGFSVNLLGSIGFKTIKRNLALPQEIYDNINLNSFVYKSEGEFRFFIPIRKRSTILLKAKGATFFNENIFFNELYRIGGIKTIRGFDEESIFPSSFLISTIEYRFILEQNANIYLFYDYGIYERNERENYQKDTPYSFGAGISFETNPGIFSLSYALGSQFDAPILLRTAKVHFGFTSFF